MEEINEKVEANLQEPKVKVYKWIYYPTLVLSLLTMFIFAFTLGELLDCTDTFTKGLAWMGILYVWGIKGLLKDICSSSFSISSLVIYMSLIGLYCVILLVFAFFGIWMGLLVGLLFACFIYLVFAIVGKCKSNKKMMITILIAITFSNCYSQVLNFQGIPIKGDATVIHKKLTSKGLVDMKKDKMYYLMKGTYMNEKAYYCLTFNPNTRSVLYLDIYISKPNDAIATAKKVKKIIDKLRPEFGRFDNYGSYWGAQIEDGGVCISSQKQMGKMMLKISFIRDELADGYLNGDYDKYLK